MNQVLRQNARRQPHATGNAPRTTHLGTAHAGCGGTSGERGDVAG
ncbi:hypothetical protein [Pseudogulbenkiania sp. NH8B]|nr:hypothetical protein [Pseudogulbenkiania sp. NH8B]